MAVVLSGLLLGGLIGWIVTTRDGADSGASPVVPSADEPMGTASTSTQAPSTTGTTATTAVPTPTTAAPPIWVPAGSSTPVVDAYETAQWLATALANDDWSTARAMQPDKAGLSDADFVAGYGDLQASQAVVVRASGAGPVTLRLGLVAHQTGPRTEVFCVTWVVDTAADTIYQLPDPAVSLGTYDGWGDPAGYVDALRSQC